MVNLRRGFFWPRFLFDFFFYPFFSFVCQFSTIRLIHFLQCVLFSPFFKNHWIQSFFASHSSCHSARRNGTCGTESFIGKKESLALLWPIWLLTQVSVCVAIDDAKSSREKLIFPERPNRKKRSAIKIGSFIVRLGSVHVATIDRCYEHIHTSQVTCTTCRETGRLFDLYSKVVTTLAAYQQSWDISLPSIFIVAAVVREKE